VARFEIWQVESVTWAIVRRVKRILLKERLGFIVADWGKVYNVVAKFFEQRTWSQLSNL
jgi:hypothetical protein